MANHAKALHHHGLAGHALKAGDHKKAAHHFGHALAALRMNADASAPAPEVPEGTDGIPTGAPAFETTSSTGPMGKSRAILAKAKGRA